MHPADAPAWPHRWRWAERLRPPATLRAARACSGGWGAITLAQRKITHELSGSLSRKAGWPCPCLEPHRRGSLTTHPGGWGARGLRPWRWLSGTKPTIHSADLYKMRARTLATTARSPSSVPDQGLNVPVRLSQRARWRSIVSSRSSSASSFFVLSRSARALRSAPSAVSTRCDLSLKLSSASNAPPASSAMRR